jgi:predicted pyridoxine 5'-phosphate oxidase superfamily flavin-nucleotide-binding protein
MDHVQNAEVCLATPCDAKGSHDLLLRIICNRGEAAGMAEQHRIASAADLRRLYGYADGLAAVKSLPKLDRYARDYIARSPFLCIATGGSGGRADVSPRGDKPGFVQVLDDRSVAIPDRPGNNRLDTMENIVVNPNVGLIFMIPGFEDTLRINGKAIITTDPRDPGARHGRPQAAEGGHPRHRGGGALSLRQGVPPRACGSRTRSWIAL